MLFTFNKTELTGVKTHFFGPFAQFILPFQMIPFLKWYYEYILSLLRPPAKVRSSVVKLYERKLKWKGMGFPRAFPWVHFFTIPKLSPLSLDGTVVLKLPNTATL